MKFWTITVHKRKGFKVTALCSEEDYPQLMKFRWYTDAMGYFIARSSEGLTKMEWVVMGGRPRPGYEVDHINGNPSDNRRENLEVVTHAENVRRSVKRHGPSQTGKGDPRRKWWLKIKKK